MTGRSKLVNWTAQTWGGRALLTAFGSTVIGLVFSISMFASMGWRHSALLSLAQFWSWGLVLPLVVTIDRRLPFSDKQMTRRALAHLPVSVVVTILYIYVFFSLRILLGIDSRDILRLSRIFQEAWGWFVWSGLIYWMIVGALYAVRYYDRFLGSELRLERMERNFYEARLNALRMQLDPHFLFNALNTISSQVERDPKLTRRMIEHLGSLLRMSLESKDRLEIPLAEELAFLEHYLEIQRIRFADKLCIETHIDPEVRCALVPSLLLQPLVENAIRHGISRRASGGTVTVSATQNDGRLEVSVSDDGVGLSPGWTLEGSSGLGLSVTLQRIEGLYPNGASFAVGPREGGGTIVEISMPLHIAEEEVHELSVD